MGVYFYIETNVQVFNDNDFVIHQHISVYYDRSSTTPLHIWKKDGMNQSGLISLYRQERERESDATRKFFSSLN